MDADHDELDFYTSPGPMTDMSGCPTNVLEGLPKDPAALMKVVRGCVTSDLMLAQIYGLPVPDRDDAQIRSVAQMVERLQQIKASPLVERREPGERFVGNCRHFATLSCALLRRAGIPARVRAGFAGYFEANTWADHWIIEYRRAPEERWVRVDPQYSDRAFQQMGHENASSEHLAGTMYWSGGEAWMRCRRGELDPDRCNMGGSNWGIGEVRGSVLYDIAALNKHEMLPWDVWGRMEAGYKGEAGEAYDDLLDSVGEAVESGDFDAASRVYEANADLRVPPEMLGR